MEAQPPARPDAGVAFPDNFRAGAAPRNCPGGKTEGASLGGRMTENTGPDIKQGRSRIMEAIRKVDHILWPNDLSKCSESALPHVRSLANRYGSTVHVLYVAEDLARRKSCCGDFSSAHIDRIVDQDMKKAEQRLEEFCQRHLEECASFDTHIALGNPVRKILEYIDDKKIDMVVMCKKGQTADFDMGGVAQKIAIMSPVPVVIVPESKKS
jgi:nucleotide-binding universal stress UspA family protein